MKKSLFLRVINGITAAFVVIVLIFAMLLYGVRLFGLTPYSVGNDGMERTYSKGDLLYVRKVDPTTVQIGQAITYIVNEDLSENTSRVVGIDGASQFFYTRADADTAQEASVVPFRNYLGTPVLSLPGLGAIYDYVGVAPGMYITIGAAALLLLLLLLPEVFFAIAQNSEEEALSQPDEEALYDGGYWEDQQDDAYWDENREEAYAQDDEQAPYDESWEDQQYWDESDAAYDEEGTYDDQKPYYDESDEAYEDQEAGEWQQDEDSEQLWWQQEEDADPDEEKAWYQPLDDKQKEQQE